MFWPFVGFSVLQIITVFSFPDMWQKMYATKSKEDFLKGGILSSVLLFLFFGVPIFILALVSAQLDISAGGVLFLEIS